MAIREKKVGEAQAEVPRETKKDAISSFRRALEDYRDAVSVAWRHEDASIRVNQVLQSETSPQKPAIDYASYLEQQASLARKLQEAWTPPEFHDTVNRALTEYVAAIKAAWAEVDSAQISPAELAHIAQLTAQAATLIAIPVNRGGSARQAA